MVSEAYKTIVFYFYRAPYKDEQSIAISQKARERSWRWSIYNCNLRWNVLQGYSRILNALWRNIIELLAFPSWVGNSNFDLGTDSVGQRGWEEGQVQKQSWHQGVFGQPLGREASRWWGCWVSRWWTVKDLVCWAKFGFYPVEDKGKTLKDFKYRKILVKCVLPGWWPAAEDAGGETQWPKAGLCRQPGFSANANHWLSAPCSASHHTCKIPKFHAHPN